MDNGQIAKSFPQSEHDIERDFLFYDMLPPELRFVLQELRGVFDSFEAFTTYNVRGPAVTLYLIWQTELNELMRYAAEYERKYKLPYPHTNAFATIQRYGPLIRPGRRLTAAQARILRRFKLLEADDDGY